MPLFLTEYLNRTLSQDGSLRSWAASGSPTPGPRESARKPVEIPRPPALPCTRWSSRTHQPARSCPALPRVLTPSHTASPTQPDLRAARIPLLQSWRLASPGLGAPSGADEPANPSVRDARRAQRARQDSPGTASHEWVTRSQCDEGRGGLSLPPKNKQPNECTRNISFGTFDLKWARTDPPSRVMQTFVTFFVLPRPRWRSGGRLAQCAPSPANFLFVFLRSVAAREERGGEKGERRRGWSEWGGEENWSLLLMAMRQLRAIVLGPSCTVPRRGRRSVRVPVRLGGLRGPEIIKLIKTETEWGLVCTFERGCEGQRGATAGVHAGDLPTQQRSAVRRGFCVRFGWSSCWGGWGGGVWTCGSQIGGPDT